MRQIAPFDILFILFILSEKPVLEHEDRIAEPAAGAEPRRVVHFSSDR